MANYWMLVNKVIERSGILLLVIDSRFPEETRNREIESKILRLDKKIIYVLNKCDLVSKEDIDRIKAGFDPCVFVSCTKKYGGTILYKKISEMSSWKEVFVGVLGYPNVGKSSVVNLLKGRKSARTSSFSGFTTGIQYVKAKDKILLLDTPGVFQYKEGDDVKRIITGAMNPQELEDPEYFAMKLIEYSPGLIGRFYSVSEEEPYAMLEEIAKRCNVLIKGGEPDMKRVSIKLIQDWQTGKVHKKALEAAGAEAVLPS